MSGKQEETSPSLVEIRAAFASRISQIVEHFQSGNRYSASISEIVDGITINNKAEEQSVYSAIDPYSKGTAKRNEGLPLIFKKIDRGEYLFLGYDGDPLDLTKKIDLGESSKLQHAFDYFKKLLSADQQSRFHDLSTSQKAEKFHKAILKAPSIYLHDPLNIELTDMLKSIKR